jgi:release factor family 2
MDAVNGYGVSALRDLYDRPGPYASVYASVRPTGEQDVLLRWRALATELGRQGVGTELVEVVRDRVFAEVPGPGVLAVYAAGEDVLLAVTMPGSAQPDAARYGALPHLLPLLEWLQDHPAYVTALVDRTGADITLYPGGTAGPVQWTVEGPDDEIERNAPGGWSQRRYQTRAEDSWEHNAVAVVEALVPVINEHAVRLLVLAGDVRALQYLEKHLPIGVTRQVAIRHVSGSRSPDGSDPLRAEQVADAVRLTVADQTASQLAQFDEERRPGGRAVEGVAPTLEAFRESRVRVLLLARDVGDARTAWFGVEPTAVSDDPEDLERAGVPPQRGPLVDVAVRSALLTRAGVRILENSGAPEAPVEGVGALCRFA